MIQSKQDTIKSSTSVKSRVSGRVPKAPKKLGDSPIPKARLAIDRIGRNINMGSPKKVGRPRKNKTPTEQAEGGDGSGGIGYESESSDRSRSSNPGDENSTGGETNDGKGDGGDRVRSF